MSLRGLTAHNRQGVALTEKLMTARAPWRELAWWMAMKLLALFLLWLLFFSPPHRSTVDSEATGNRFALDGTILEKEKSP